MKLHWNHICETGRLIICFTFQRFKNGWATCAAKLAWKQVHSVAAIPPASDWFLFGNPWVSFRITAAHPLPDKPIYQDDSRSDLGSYCIRMEVFSVFHTVPAPTFCILLYSLRQNSFCRMTYNPYRYTDCFCGSSWHIYSRWDTLLLCKANGSFDLFCYRRWISVKLPGDFSKGFSVTQALFDSDPVR